MMFSEKWFYALAVVLMIVTWVTGSEVSKLVLFYVMGIAVTLYLIKTDKIKVIPK